MFCKIGPFLFSQTYITERVWIGIPGYSLSIEERRGELRDVTERLTGQFGPFQVREDIDPASRYVEEMSIGVGLSSPQAGQKVSGGLVTAGMSVFAGIYQSPVDNGFVVSSIGTISLNGLSTRGMIGASSIAKISTDVRAWDLNCDLLPDNTGSSHLSPWEQEFLGTARISDNQYLLSYLSARARADVSGSAKAAMNLPSVYQDAILRNAARYGNSANHSEPSPTGYDSHGKFDLESPELAQQGVHERQAAELSTRPEMSERPQRPRPEFRGREALSAHPENPVRNRPDHADDHDGPGRGRGMRDEG